MALRVVTSHCQFVVMALGDCNLLERIATSLAGQISYPTFS